MSEVHDSRADAVSRMATFRLASMPWQEVIGR